jgi:hypothetical protein
MKNSGSQKTKLQTVAWKGQGQYLVGPESESPRRARSPHDKRCRNNTAPVAISAAAGAAREKPRLILGSRIDPCRLCHGHAPDVKRGGPRALVGFARPVQVAACGTHASRPDKPRRAAYDQFVQVRGELVAFLNFSRTGNELLLAFIVGGFVCAILFNLVRVTTAVRATVLVLGIAVALIFVFTRPYGEDRAAWAIIMGFALLAWFLGFAAAGVARAIRQRR